jgi:purine-cytosine permease-like protein
VLIAIYLLLCVVIGLVGISRKTGFLSYFFLSVIFTPFVMLLYVLISQYFIRRCRAARERKCLDCKHEKKVRMYAYYCNTCQKTGA